jgi:hypothetical protein
MLLRGVLQATRRYAHLLQQHLFTSALTYAPTSALIHALTFALTSFAAQFATGWHELEWLAQSLLVWCSGCGMNLFFFIILFSEYFIRPPTD